MDSPLDAGSPDPAGTELRARFPVPLASTGGRRELPPLRTHTTQLDLLQAELARPLVARFATERGGPALLAALPAAARALRTAASARLSQHGTPAETEAVDLLDGLIVSLVRRARKAARFAARILGRPALARAFELERLYASRSRNGGSSPAGAADAGPGSGDAAA